MPRIAVVGAGAAGLVAARRLQELGAEPVLFEAATRVGGSIETVRRDGWMAEAGPNTVMEPDRDVRAPRPRRSRRSRRPPRRRREAALPRARWQAPGAPTLARRSRRHANPLHVRSAPHAQGAVRRQGRGRPGRDGGRVCTPALR
ncbi:MAG: NAD(P)-binding protein [Gemmatimonadetes bacterium]|nr:NAD(P)-binding protein [Gemmatimonadota bacterium]